MLRFCAKATLIPAARMSRQMAKEWRSQKPEVQDRFRFVIWLFVIISSFVIRMSSFCSHLSNHIVAKLRAPAFARLRRDFTRWQNSHVGNNVAAKLATLDLGRAFHQAREIVSDALARDRAFPTLEHKTAGFPPTPATKHPFPSQT